MQNAYKYDTLSVENIQLRGHNMLTRVQIKNINAIDYCDIDFQKGKYKYLENMIYQDKLVNPVAFYGTNGSGKSSFLEAISYLLTLMLQEPHALNIFVPNFIKTMKLLDEEDKKVNGLFTDQHVYDIKKSIKSSIKIFFEIDQYEYEYFIETALYGWIDNEYLKVNENYIFERTTESYVYNDRSVDIKQSLYPILRRLASEVQDDDFVSASYSFISNFAYADALKKHYIFKDGIEKDYKDIVVEKSAEVAEILSSYNEFPIYTIHSKPTNEGKKSYYLRMSVDGKDVDLPYGMTSGGMRSQSVLLSILLSIPKNGVFFIDEIEDALHPLTILDFIKVAQEREVQLIFSSHNTYLLQKLRPDQIFFANWKNGYSTYKKLSDIYPNIREVNNIEKMYFSNMFDEDIKND